MEDQYAYNEEGLYHECVDAQIASTISPNEFSRVSKKTKLSYLMKHHASYLPLTGSRLGREHGG
eukprot:11744650-Ditylum_brightwellii.AAC.1